MSRHPEPVCGKTDAVLALYLDGDVEGDTLGADASGFAFACTETLASHLRECRSCQRELQRARRLDALLAETSGRGLANHLDAAGGVDALAARWSHPEHLVVNAGEPQLPVPDPQRIVVAIAGVAAFRDAHRGAFRLFAASAAGLALIVAARFLAQPAAPVRLSVNAGRTTPLGPSGRSGERVPEARVAPVAPVVATAAALPIIPVAEDAARRRPSVPAALPIDVAAEQLRLADANELPGVRLAAAKLLLLASRPGMPNATATLARLTETLAAGHAGNGRQGQAAVATLAAVHTAMRKEGTFMAYLRSVVQRLETPHSSPGLDELAAFTVACRLGDLDAAVLRSLRRHPELDCVVAAALRTGLRRDGAGLLLLDCWGDLADRGEGAERGERADRGERAERGDNERLDDGLAAERWFRGQPPAVFDEVRAELATTRSGPRRVRCLLALGHCPSMQHQDTLLAWSATGYRPEAYAAAFSLAEAPADRLRPLANQAAQDRDAVLLRAALARAELAEAAAWVDPLLLSPADRAQLTHGTFAQFPTVVAWFRDRAPAGD